MALGDNRAAWAATFAVVTLPLLGFWAYGLFDLDEGFYAAVTREMLRSGDWIIPRYNGGPWLEKPILLYWLAAPCVLTFGEAVGPRLPSVLATLGVCALCAAYVRSRVSDEAGRWTALILGTSPLIAGAGRMMLTDPSLVLFTTASLLCYFESLLGRREWRALAGACLGFAVLAKGPVALVIFLAVAVWTFLVEPQTRARFGGWLPNTLGMALFALVVSLWYLPAYMRSPDAFVREFLIEQNVGRFAGGDVAHSAPLWAIPLYYPLAILLGMFPWSLGIVRAWPRQREAEAAEPAGALRRYCARWALVTLVLFSASGSKLPHYILPALPALAVLVANQASRTANRSKWLGVPSQAWVASLSLALILNAGFGWYYHVSGQAEAHALARWLVAQGDPVIAYALGDRKGDPPGPAFVQENSLPSLNFVLKRDPIRVDRPDGIPSGLRGAWFLTRRGRVNDELSQRLRDRGYVLRRAETPIERRVFEVYRLETSGSSSSSSLP